MSPITLVCYCQDVEHLPLRHISSWSQSTTVRRHDGKIQSHAQLCPDCFAPVHTLTSGNYAILSTSVRLPLHH